MPTYISLIRYTEQGVKNIQDSPKRLDAAKKMLKEMGGEVKQFYLTMGEYDIVTVAEAPSDEVITRFFLTLNSLGNVRTSTLKAFPEGEYRKIVGAIPKKK